VASENLYGKSFAKTTGKSINKEYSAGVTLPAKENYQT